MGKTKILVSACLLGEPCRYDGRSVPCPDALLLPGKYELFKFCPEQEGGLPTPRIPSERVLDKVINKIGEDVTENYKRGAEKALELCLSNDIKLAVMKEKSPSCGSTLIYDGSFSKNLIPGVGVTTELLRKYGITVIGEDEIKKLL